MIQQSLQAYIDSDYLLSGVGGSYTGRDFKALLEVLQGTERDFVIFNNAGGKPFMIWFDGHTLSILEHFKNMVFCYQLEGKQIILKEFYKKLN